MEEIYETTSGRQAYAITGCFYRAKDRRLETTSCFQANYTRDPDKRPNWFSFSLDLKVSLLNGPAPEASGSVSKKQ